MMLRKVVRRGERLAADPAPRARPLAPPGCQRAMSEIPQANARRVATTCTECRHDNARRSPCDRPQNSGCTENATARPSAGCRKRNETECSMSLWCFRASRPA